MHLLSAPISKSCFGWSLLLMALREIYLALSRKGITSFKRETTQPQLVHQPAKLDPPQQRHPQGRWGGTSGHTWKRSIRVIWTDALHSHNSFQDDEKKGDVRQSTLWLWRFLREMGSECLNLMMPQESKIPWSKTKTVSGWFSFRKKRWLGPMLINNSCGRKDRKMLVFMLASPARAFHVKCAVCKVFWLSYLISHQSTRVIKKWVVYLDG